MNDKKPRTWRWWLSTLLLYLLCLLITLAYLLILAHFHFPL